MSSPRDDASDHESGPGEDEEMNEIHSGADSERRNDNDDDESGTHDINDSSVSPGILGDMEESDYEVMTRQKYDNLRLKCERRKAAINARNKRISKLDDKNKELQRKIKELEDEIDKLKNRPRRPRQPWRELLRAYGGGGDTPGYEYIYRQSCKQENMSQKKDIVHPDITLSKTLSEALSETLSENDSEHESPSPPDDDYTDGCLPFPFEKLPTETQGRILYMALVKPTLIHCLSRLDPYYPPDNFPAEDDPKRTQLLNRFHYGTSPCCINRARKPNDTLAPLLVCKRWYFIGVHAFYGANTFAFSSLGEWHRFCNGIGKARVERLTNVELMWHGALMPPHESRISQRTLGLVWLTKTKRLRTLVVHIHESKENRTRRKYEQKRKDEREEDYPFQATDDEVDDEDLDPYQLMVRRTKLQPNYRKFRSMRTVQGMDYIYQLRGMEWVRFKDVGGLEHRQSIRDWSFLKDINTVVTMPKPASLERSSQFENLTPLSGLENWDPSDNDMQLINQFYNDTSLVRLIDRSKPTSSPFSHHDSGYDSEGPGDDSTIGSESSNDTDGPDRPDGPSVIDIMDSESDSDSDTESDSDSDSDSSDDDDDDDDGDEPQGALNPTIPKGPAPPVIELILDDDDDDDGSSSDNLFVTEGSISGDATTAGQTSMSIDLTGDGDSDIDAESSLFVRSNSTTDNRTIKTDPSSDQVYRKLIDLTMLDSDEDDEDEEVGRGNDQGKEKGDNGNKRVKKEPPSDSSDSGNNNRSSTSPKHPRDNDADPDGEAPAPKRPKGPSNPNDGSGGNNAASPN
ncbi:hypothetical protein F4779DRAFT_130203 [Xylariaceae sp. FL0662B]|nr:hypothetical protein F4779DRAFT_130203 [Xylariaceae sp. FL0662B]